MVSKCGYPNRVTSIATSCDCRLSDILIVTVSESWSRYIDGGYCENSTRERQCVIIAFEAFKSGPGASQEVGLGSG